MPRCGRRVAPPRAPGATVGWALRRPRQGRGSPPRAQPAARPPRLGSSRPAAQSASSEERERASARASERVRARAGGGAGAAAARVLAARLPEGEGGVRGASCSCAPPRARPRRVVFPPRAGWVGEGGQMRTRPPARLLARPRAAGTKSAAGTSGLAPAPLAAEPGLRGGGGEEAGARSRGAAGGFRPGPASWATLPIGLPAPEAREPGVARGIPYLSQGSGACPGLPRCPRRHEMNGVIGEAKHAGQGKAAAGPSVS